MFFRKARKKPNYNETLQKLEDNDLHQFDKQEILIRHMVRVWINQVEEDFYFRILDEYYNNNKEQAINQLKSIIEKYDIEGRWSSRILSSVDYQLSELGELKEKNIFYGKTLEELISERAIQGSFDVSEYAKSFIRLANYENNNIDIYSVNKVWAMYYNRKDYSVYTLDVALKVFERYGYLNEIESIGIIIKVMNQSEKGIRHLLSSYINMGDESLIHKLEQVGAFYDENFPVDIFDLTPDKIDCIDIEHIVQRLCEVLSYHSYGKTIEFEDIIRPLKSKYCSWCYDIIHMLQKNI